MDVKLTVGLNEAPSLDSFGTSLRKSEWCLPPSLRQEENLGDGQEVDDKADDGYSG